jgi:hypothetical protein
MTEIATAARTLNGMRFRDNDGITVDQELRKAFPAVFNTRRSTVVSEDYKLYRSDKIIDIMQDNGMKLVEIGQERIGWSKKRFAHTQIHMLRFREAGLSLKNFGVNDSFPEIVMMNSHDGRCMFRAMAGIFRLVCLNGMVVADADLGSVKRRHYGEANDFLKVQEILAALPAQTVRISKTITAWDSLELNRKEQKALSKLLLKERAAPDWVEADQLLEARRPADEAKADGSRSLWLTFNVLQEALTNATVERQGGEGRGRSIRPISAVAGNIATNQKLWAQADAYATKLAKRRGVVLVAA